MKMRIISAMLLAVITLCLSSCGYGSRDNEAVGQVKSVRNVTPMVCPDFIQASLSLGVMRNGVGSMSTEDVDVTVKSEKQLEVLKSAAESGKLVRFRYDATRVRFCEPFFDLVSVDILDGAPSDSNVSSK